MPIQSAERETQASMPGNRWHRFAALVALIAIAIHVLTRYLLHWTGVASLLPLWIAMTIGGLPLLYELASQFYKRRFGADFLAGMSVVTAAIMGEWLVATIIILMRAGGQVLEAFATRRASSALRALAKRMPTGAHRLTAEGVVNVSLEDVQVGDHLVVFPHEICPVDGTVLRGDGTMDESFLTGEPYKIRKTAGIQVISGALNQGSALTIRADNLPSDSRLARIMQVVQEAEENPPQIRRLADSLGAWYTPLSLLIALAGWALSGVPERFLAVLVIATPCPLLLAIPISVMGAISLAARRGIVIRKPAILEQVDRVQTIFFDKTGTLTHGEPVVTGVVPLAGTESEEVLRLCASLEQYSKHPLAGAILRAATEKGIQLANVEHASEKPGEGLSGQIDGSAVLVTGRSKLSPEVASALPRPTQGMECVALVNGVLYGLIRFHDRPRSESKAFVAHLKPKHHVRDLRILSGDRETEVKHLGSIVGIDHTESRLSPEQKLAIVREETTRGTTMFLGDGVNDAPAMLAATVGVAFGQNSDVTAQAAGAVIMESNLGKVDELLHIGSRMRHIALQSAVGGMAVSLAGMVLAAMGYLPPIMGALAQEIIDLVAVLNALRASLPGHVLRDF